MPRFGGLMPPLNRSLHEFIRREAASVSKLREKHKDPASALMLNALAALARGEQPNIGRSTRRAMLRREWITTENTVTPFGHMVLNHHRPQSPP